MNAKELYDAGRLDEAISAASDAVRAKPRDPAARSFLCELLCFAGQLERADKQLDALAQLESEMVLGVALFRQLIRAEQSRHEFFTAGRVPEFIGEVSPEMRLRLQACVESRANDLAAATATLEAAEGQRRAPHGVCDGKPFEDLRDMDDLTASVLEVLTSTGKYYWIGLDRVIRVELKPPQQLRDLLWRQAEMKVENGPEGVVYLPVLYPGSAQSTDDGIRLGRMTDWVAGDVGPIRGIGQRMLLVGNEDRSFLELGCLEFASGAS